MEKTIVIQKIIVANGNDNRNEKDNRIGKGNRNRQDHRNTDQLERTSFKDTTITINREDQSK